MTWSKRGTLLSLPVPMSIGFLVPQIGHNLGCAFELDDLSDV